MNSSKYFGAIIAVFVALGSAAHGQSDHAQVGKTGHLTLKQETRVGDAVLPAGHYEVRHRRSLNGHFVEFTRMVDTDRGQTGASPYGEVVAEVPCTMKPLNTSIAETSVDTSKGTDLHISDLRIRGENVVHIFPAGPDPSAPQNQVEYGGGGGI